MYVFHRPTSKRTTHSPLTHLQSLETQVEKYSPTLGRNALYTQKSRLTRLPGYLAVHMVRFAWKSEIGKKAKILVCNHSIPFV